VFKQPKFLQNSFSLLFSRQVDIRRKSLSFEDKLKGDYFQPQILPVPDEFQADAPRFIFGSIHGFSQIIVSQISIVLNVSYSPDWQLDIEKGRDYLHKKVLILFDLLEIIGKGPIAYYCGLGTRVQLPSEEPEQDILKRLSDMYLPNIDISTLNEVQLKLGKMIANKYYSNIVIGNYRSWDNVDFGQSIPSFPNKNAIERGVEIATDFNDRIRYNEDATYRSNRDEADKIIDLGIGEIQSLLLSFKV
jgi:hypothetical protein